LHGLEAVKVERSVPLIKIIKQDGQQLYIINGNTINTKFTLVKSAWVDVKIVDLSNPAVIIVALGEKIMGTHLFRWNGTDSSGKFMSDGQYFVQLTTWDPHKKSFTVKIQRESYEHCNISRTNDENQRNFEW
jgi:flagellar hook assembly protein FlgD